MGDRTSAGRSGSTPRCGRSWRTLRILSARHMAPALACVDACTRLLPDVPQICAFDTAFHATLPDEARTYAVPARVARGTGAAPLRLPRAERGLVGAADRRAPRRAAPAHRGLSPGQRLLGDRGPGGPVGRHQHGLHAARRSGDGHPGRPARPRSGARHRRAPRHRAHRRRGTAGGRMRAPGAGRYRRPQGGPRAARPRAMPTPRSAYAVYLHALLRAVGGAAGVLGGLDVLVFTGGAGEHSAPLRADVCAGLAFLGVALDHPRNRHAGRARRRSRAARCTGAGAAHRGPGGSGDPRRGPHASLIEDGTGPPSRRLHHPVAW